MGLEYSLGTINYELDRRHLFLVDYLEGARLHVAPTTSHAGVYRSIEGPKGTPVGGGRIETHHQNPGLELEFCERSRSYGSVPNFALLELGPLLVEKVRELVDQNVTFRTAMDERLVDNFWNQHDPSNS